MLAFLHKRVVPAAPRESTSSVEAKVPAPVTPRVPPTAVFPVAAATVKAVEFTEKSPVTTSVPPTISLPVTEALLSVARPEVERVESEEAPVTPNVPPSVVAPELTVKVFVPVTADHHCWQS